MPTEVLAKQRQRIDTAANWTSNDPTLLLGELGLESDTEKFKIGDGTTAWTALAYSPHLISDPSGVTGADQVTNIMSLTQAEYDAIGAPDASTLYVIV